MQYMYIPAKIKVGFQKRNDTFTGKLAYVIYYDEKNVLRKEGSWKSWCDDSIPSIELDNTPQPGFILNKGVQRNGHWGSGRSVIRVYDPRDFEFEVSVDNLIGILMHSDVSKRDIVENCVFAWKGKDLILLPTNSEDYIQSVEYTNKQSSKVSSKDFVQGYTYHAKKLTKPLTYIGYFEWFDQQYTGEQKSKGKKHIFYDGSEFICKTAADLSSVADANVATNYSALVDKFYTTANSQPIVGIKIKKSNKNDRELCFYDEKKKKIIDIIRNYENKYTEQYHQDIIFEPSFFLTYSNDYHGPNSREMTSLEKKATDIYNQIIDKRQLSTELFKIGIGQLTYVLKNGSEINANSY